MFGVDLLEGVPGALVVVLVANCYSPLGRLRLQMGLHEVKRVREELPDDSAQSSEQHTPVQDHVTVPVLRVSFGVRKLVCTCNQKLEAWFKVKWGVADLTDLRF